MLYAFGSNGSGQLGLGHCDDVSVPSKVFLAAPETTAKPSKIAAGGNHTLLLLSTGDMYACGLNTDGRYGTVANQHQHTIFQKIEIQYSPTQIISKFRLCAATWESSTFVDEDGRVFTSGTGHKGQLGQGPSVSSCGTPTLIHGFPPLGTQIVDLVASMGHTVAVLSDGSVYGWGTGRKGQLGQPSRDCWIPRKVESIPFHAMRAACGKDFTYIVGDAGEGQHLIFGSDKWQVVSAAPREVHGWRDISASWSNIYVLLDSGILLAWGRNDHGQIPSEGLASVTKLAAGSEHVLVFNGAIGTCLAYGWGEHGNCGDLKGNQDAPVSGSPVLVEPEVLQMGAGCATSWIIT
ncbi:MAG: hypothetical protein Q9157_008407 [Trypethelium eluteriae]